MPLRLRLITNSELKARRRCAREHHIAYELGYRSTREDEDALRFGTVVHKALEAWWLAPTAELRITYALEALHFSELDPYAMARARQMLIAYDTRWTNEPLELVRVPAGSDNSYVPMVEPEFRAPLINPMTGQASRTFELGGKLDALVRDLRDDRVYIVEHKTSSDDLTPGSLYWQLLQLDTQVSTYYAGARALGFDPAGVLYDVLRKPALRPLQATPIEARKYTTKTGALYATQRELDETPQEYEARVMAAIGAEPDRYLMRGIVVRLEQEERDAQWDAWQEARAVREAELAQRWPRNPDGCRRFGRLCSYFDVCTGTAQLEDTSRFTKVTQVHAELTTARETPA